MNTKNGCYQYVNGPLLMGHMSNITERSQIMCSVLEVTKSKMQNLKKIAWCLKTVKKLKAHLFGFDRLG